MRPTTRFVLYGTTKRGARIPVRIMGRRATAERLETATTAAEGAFRVQLKYARIEVWRQRREGRRWVDDSKCGEQT